MNLFFYDKNEKDYQTLKNIKTIDAFTLTNGYSEITVFFKDGKRLETLGRIITVTQEDYLND